MKKVKILRLVVETEDGRQFNATPQNMVRFNHPVLANIRDFDVLPSDFMSPPEPAAPVIAVPAAVLAEVQAQAPESFSSALPTAENPPMSSTPV